MIDLNGRSSAPPTIRGAPAPWSLTGDAYVFLLRLPQKMIDEESFIPAPLKGAAEGRTGVFMFVDYTSSAVGPYRELLYIPCRFRVDGRLCWSITRIYVSSEESVANCRENRGIPKELADFQVTREGSALSVKVRRDGEVFADLSFKTLGFGLPASSVMLPEATRTLVQIKDDRRFFYAPSAKGKARLARITAARFDPVVFPDVTRGSVILGAKLEGFEMLFPAARIEG